MDVVRGTAPRAHGHERISRRRRGHRRLHDPQGQVQIRALRRHAAAALRSRGRSLRDARPRRRTPAIAASLPTARRPCARSSIQRQPMRRRARTRPPRSPSSAGARRSSPGAASAILPCPARSRSTTRAGTVGDSGTARTSARESLLQLRPAAAGRASGDRRCGRRSASRKARIPSARRALSGCAAGGSAMGVDEEPIAAGRREPVARGRMSGRSPSIPSPSRTTGSASLRSQPAIARRPSATAGRWCSRHSCRTEHQALDVQRRTVLVAARRGCLLEASGRAAIDLCRPARSSRRARVVERRRRVRGLGRRPSADRGGMGVRGGRRARQARSIPGATEEPDDAAFQPCNIWQGEFPDAQ